MSYIASPVEQLVLDRQLAERLLASPTVIEPFAGPGGWDEGLRPLGITPRGIDNARDACDTGRAAGHYRHLGNVAAMEPRDVLGPWGGVEGLIASPPCPGFAHGGLKRGKRDGEVVLERLPDVGSRDDLDRLIRELDLSGAMTDERTLLALEPLRWALTLAPRWLAWEQVPYVLPLWDACATLLRAYGYSVATGLLEAEAFGVPQVRRRAVLVARSAELTAQRGPATLPAPTHSRWHRDGRLDPGLPRWRSMSDALGWGMTDRPYPAVAAGTSRGGQDPMMLGGSGAREAVRRELAAGRWLSTPERPANASSEWNLDTRRALRLTVAEAGVLQSFRGDYPWQGRRTRQYQQAGDAVPPPVARAIVEAVR